VINAKADSSSEGINAILGLRLLLGERVDGTVTGGTGGATAPHPLSQSCFIIAVGNG
jgi:hypothetical protein